MLMVSVSFSADVPTYVYHPITGQLYKIGYRGVIGNFGGNNLLMNTSSTNQTCGWAGEAFGKEPFLFYTNNGTSELNNRYRINVVYQLDVRISGSYHYANCSYQEVMALYYKTNDTCTAPKQIINGECIVPPVVCSENMKKSSDGQSCICNDGYKPDDVTYDTAGNITKINTCKPFKNCPPQMKYFWTDKATTILGTQTDYAGCIPRTDLSELS